jgi:protein involved in sex pheromone biosynthesis
MKMKLAILVLGSALSLAACAGQNSGALDPRAQQAAQVVGEVQEATKTVCNFVPTVKTIADIFASGVPYVGATANIANGICSALNGPRARRHGKMSPPEYRGVVIRGKHVR